MTVALTVDQELVIRERLESNQCKVHDTRVHEAYGKQIIAQMRRSKAIRDPFQVEVECVVCGSKMTAQRRSKKTCSSACRLRLSRWMRVWKALPQAEKDKRERKIQKRWRRARASAKAEEKRKPKPSRAEIIAEMVTSLKAFNEEALHRGKFAGKHCKLARVVSVRGRHSITLRRAL
jgi:hypothetical protein